MRSPRIREQERRRRLEGRDCDCFHYDEDNEEGEKKLNLDKNGNPYQLIKPKGKENEDYSYNIWNEKRKPITHKSLSIESVEAALNHAFENGVSSVSFKVDSSCAEWLSEEIPKINQNYRIGKNATYSHSILAERKNSYGGFYTITKEEVLVAPNISLEVILTNNK